MAYVRPAAFHADAMAVSVEGRWILDAVLRRVEQVEEWLSILNANAVGLISNIRDPP